MKKTLIALMALTSSAFAMDPVTQALTLENFNSTLTQISTWNATEYTLTLTIGGVDFDGYTSDFMVKFADDWGVLTQAGSYVAMDYTGTNDRTWVAPTTTEGTTFTWTATDETKLDSWVSKSTTGENAAPGVNGMTITLDVDTTGSVITLGMTNGTTSIIETGYVVKLADVKLIDGSADGANQGVTGISNASITYVPEPATATLSLLALADLAARRRRK